MLVFIIQSMRKLLLLEVESYIIMVEEPRAWPEAYGIVFALGMCSGKIEGRVKLNKALALLQRDGFPIPNRFYNDKMGPYDPRIDFVAEEIKKDHFISIIEKPTTFENNRFDYNLLKEGKDYFKEHLDEQLAFANGQPFEQALFENFKKTRNALTLTSTELVEQVHAELGLDHHGRLLKETGRIRTNLSKEIDDTTKHASSCCPICLEVLGSLDLALHSLDAIEKQSKGWQNIPEYSGRTFLLFSIERLIDYSNKFREHEHTLDIRMGKDRQSLIRSRILLRLHCIEYNGSLYDIIDPLNAMECDLEEISELRA